MNPLKMTKQDLEQIESEIDEQIWDIVKHLERDRNFTHLQALQLVLNSLARWERLLYPRTT